MSDDRSDFLNEGQSIASTVSQLHNYFVNVVSTYQIERERLLARIKESEGDAQTSLSAELVQLEEQMSQLGVVRDALAIANGVLHSHSCFRVFGREAEIYQTQLPKGKEQFSEKNIG